MATSTVPEMKALSNPSDAVEARLQAITEMLVYGAAQQEILALVQKQWGVSQRTAQDDLYTVRQRLTGEAAAEDHLFSLRVSQLQRDKLVGLALRYMVNPPEDLDPKLLQSLAALLTAVRGLLDSRDKTAAEIQQLVEQRLQQGAKVLPAPETPRPAASSNSHIPTPVAHANGKRHVRRCFNGDAMAPATHAPADGEPVHVALRPPLPASSGKTDQAGGVCAPNYRGDQEIRHGSAATVSAAAVCAACAESP
jgi:hypothetical protein